MLTDFCGILTIDSYCARRWGYNGKKKVKENSLRLLITTYEVGIDKKQIHSV